MSIRSLCSTQMAWGFEDHLVNRLTSEVDNIEAFLGKGKGSDAELVYVNALHVREEA